MREYTGKSSRKKGINCPQRPPKMGRAQSHCVSKQPLGVSNLMHRTQLTQRARNLAEDILNASIPTTYHGRRFRSRLEARWAAMFDLLGWKYEYEPYDLNGWIPDFALFGAEEIIVEVKPYRLLSEFDTKKILTALEGTDKWGKEILLLGFTIWEKKRSRVKSSCGSRLSW